MKSVLDELAEGPEAWEEFGPALDRFISARGLLVSLPAQEELDTRVAPLLERIAAWTEKSTGDEAPRTERLVRCWLRRRLPSLRQASEQFRTFAARERSSRPTWSFLHFIGNWFVTERNPVAVELVLIFEVILSKTIDDQEQGIREAVNEVVRRIRVLEKAAADLKAEIEARSVPDSPPFWPGVVDGFAAAIRATVGEEAARATVANMQGAFPGLAAPFLALARLRPGWMGLIAAIDHMGASTIDAMQENFTSRTLGAAHAPEKRGLRLRIALLARAGFSQSEIGEFEGITAAAVAEHLRRLRDSSKTA
jgi:hypothetical protein